MPTTTLELNITGMDCADCALTLEKGVANLKGVSECQVNFAAAKMKVSGDLDEAEIVKQIKKFSEEARISVRHKRRDAIEMIKSLEKDKDISEDDARRASDKIQEIHDDYIKKVDEISVRKEKEVMEI